MTSEGSGQMTDSKVPIEAIHIIDPQVTKELERFTGGIKEFTVLNIVVHGSSLWTRTARVDTEFPGQCKETIRKSFFLKVTYGEGGKKMAESEKVCMDELRGFAPELAPEAFATGTYSNIQNVYFLLCEFRSMDDKLPLPGDLAPKVAELHRMSREIGRERHGSDTKRFGQCHSTFHGSVCVDHGLFDRWETYFTETTRALFCQEQSVQGPNEEIKQMIEPFFDKVIPRLLRPLETGGRSLFPCLIHGDLWHGNVGTDKATGNPIIFDAASIWAHNEYELGVWRQPWNEINEVYREEYHKHFPPSKPAEDFNDRNALYAIRVNLLDSILYKNEKTYRNMLIVSMRELMTKFPGGLEEWKNSNSTSKTLF